MHHKDDNGKTVVIFTTDAFSLLNFRGKLIKELVARGHRVHAISPDFSDEMKLSIERLGATPHDIDFNRVGTHIIEDFQSSLKLLKLLGRLKPDCILSYFVKPVIYGTLCAFLAGVPHRVAMIEGLGSTFSSGTTKKVSARRLLISLMYKIALMFAHKIIFLNEDDIQEFHARKILHKKRALLLGGIGVDLKEWVNDKSLKSPFTFTMSARMLREKGVQVFADAAREVKKIYPEVRFLLLGALDANPDSLTEAEITRWVDEKILEWHGHVSVRPWLAQTSVFVLPSYYREGIPRSSQEALSMGLPIITTDSVGCKETVVDQYNGYLIPIKDSEALAEKMKLFLQNPDCVATMGANSRKLAELKFSEEEKIKLQLDYLKCS